MVATCSAVCPPNAPVAFAHPPIICGCEPAAPPVPAGPPLVSTAAQSGADTIRITFNQAVAATPQVAPTAFTFTSDSVPARTVVTASLNGNQVNLVLSGPATFTTGSVSYTPTGTGDLVAADDATPVAAFSNQAVTPL